MSLPIYLLFSGQGSQYYGMGREMFDRHPGFRRRMLEMDEAARAGGGASRLHALYDSGRPRHEAWERTAETHPALFMIQYAMAECLIESGVAPAGVLGASLGEFVAAAVSGVLGWEELLRAVILQAGLLEARCEPGYMTAVLQPPSLYREDATLRAAGELAGQSFASHFVISGPRRNLAAVSSALKARDAVFLTLPVTQAFHSSVIDVAEREYLAGVSGLVMRRPRIPFWSCAAAGALAEASPSHLWEAVRRPIRLRETLAILAAGGDCAFLDAGPSGTLAAAAKQNLPAGSGSRIASLLPPFGKEAAAFESTLRSLAA